MAVSGDWLSVEEVARALGLQPRTVRNYIRDGRLPAVRIGKQYRISVADFAAFTGSDAAGSEPGGGEIDQRGPAPDRSIDTDVTTVVQITGLAPGDLHRLTTLFTAAGASPGADVRVVQVPSERRLKAMVSGSLEPVTSFLSFVQSILDTGL